MPTHLPHRVQGLAWLAYHSSIQPALSFMFAATADREGPSSPSPPVALPETEFTSNRTDLIDVTQDPDLRPAQACLVLWIRRVYRPLASCLGSSLPDAIASSRHMHKLTPSYAPSFSPSPPLCMCMCVPGRLCPWFPGRHPALQYPPHPLSQEAWAIVIRLFSAPRPDQSCRIVSGRGACREAFVSGWDEFSVRQ